MDNNGGSHSFEAEDLTNNKEWTYAFKGYAFVVGFLPENGVVRINRLKDNAEEENNVLSNDKNFKKENFDNSNKEHKEIFKEILIDLKKIKNSI